MKLRNSLYLIFGLLSLGALTSGCADHLTDEPSNLSIGKPATAEVGIGEQAQIDSRVVSRGTHNPYDQWSTYTFTREDNVGLFAVKGMQNAEDENKYDTEIKNGKMFFEAANGSRYRFSNSEIIINPQTVHDNYSIMYYPYYEGMPDPYDTSITPGLPLRRTDATDGIVKCVDFMQTSMYSYVSYSSYYSSTIHKLTLTSGVLQPNFYHYMAELVIQRGFGFRNARDPRIWVVMKTPHTDIRVMRSTSNYTYELQNALDTGEKLGVPTNLEDGKEPKVTVNANRVWEAWQGADYNGLESYYAIIPPSPAEVAYIVIQDDYGEWQAVSDFYLDFPNNTSSRQGKNNCRYIVTVEIRGSQAQVRPVIVENWTDGGLISDQYNVGINSLAEFRDWVAVYNSYTENKSPELEEQLKKYGNATSNGSSISWTFYLNTNLTLPDGFSDNIKVLEDVLMGSSVYTNFSISNIQSTLIGEMRGNGALKSLDFYDLYLIDIEDNGESFTGGLIGKMEEGTIDHCNVLNGIVVSNKAAGMIGGAVSSGTLSHCKISGQVIGVATMAEPYQGVFGSDADPDKDFIITDTNHKELYFEYYN